jgi:hypothetical protein
VARVTGSEIVKARPLTARSAAFVRLADEHLDDSYRLFIQGTRQPTAEATEKVLRALAATAIERLVR